MTAVLLESLHFAGQLWNLIVQDFEFWVTDTAKVVLHDKKTKQNTGKDINGILGMIAVATSQTLLPIHIKEHIMFMQKSIIFPTGVKWFQL